MPSPVSRALVAAVVVLAAVPFVAAKSYDAGLVVVSVEGLAELPTNYEYRSSGDAKSYTVTGRLASDGARVYLNVTSPANARSTDAARLAVEYPISWTEKGTSNDTRPRTEEAAVRASFVLGPLPATPPTGPAIAKATVEKTTFTLRILPASPILVLEAPAEDGIAYVDVTGEAPFAVRTLYYPEGDRLVGPAILGGQNLKMPSSTDIRANARYELRPGADIPCGLHGLSVASLKVKGTSTSSGTIYGPTTGPLDAVAVLRAPSLALPAGFVTDVAPAEFTLKCFPPQSRVEVRWAPPTGDDWRALGTYTVADSGGLDEFLTFPDLGDATTVRVQARVVEGPSVLGLGRYVANATVPVRQVESSDELNLVVDVATDRAVYDLGDLATVTGTVRVAGKPASGVDVTVVWPFEDRASAREDRLQSRTVRTDAQGAFSVTFTAGPAGSGASFAPTATQGERSVVATARKAGLNTGFDRATVLSTGLAPFALKDVRFRPEVVAPGGEVQLLGQVTAPGILAGTAGVVDGARIELRSDAFEGTVVGRAGADGAFSVRVPVPADTSPGAYPVAVVAWGRAPEALGGVLVAPGTAGATLKVGAQDAKPVGRDQRVTVAEMRSLGEAPAQAEIVHLGTAVAATKDAAVAHGDRVAVPPGREAVLALHDQATNVTLGNATRAVFLVSRVAGDASSTVLVLHAPGELRFDASDAAPAHASPIVVLTRFHEIVLDRADAVLTATGDGGLDLQVWEGSATVADRDGGTADVEAGRRLALAADATAADAATTSLTGASPFAPPPPAPSDDEPEPDRDAPPVDEGGGNRSPGPWIGAVLLAAVAAALARRR